MKREMKKIAFEFRKMFHVLFLFLIGNLFLTVVLFILPEPAAWADTKVMQVLFFLSSVFYIISAYVYLLFIFTSIVRYFTGEYYLLEQLNGTSLYKIFAYKFPVNLLLYGFVGMDYYGINILLPKYLMNSPAVYMHTISQTSVLLVEGLIFGPIFVAFVYLWLQCHMKYLAGLNTIIICLVMLGITGSIDCASWKICVVEVILSILMLWKSQNIAISRYEQV